MQALRTPEFGRAIVTALLTVSIASSAMAQTSRISRTEADFNDLNRRLPAGEIGSLEDLRSRPTVPAPRSVDYSKVDKRALANLMKETIDESGRLYASLDADYRRNLSLRPMLSDLQKLRGLANLVSQDMAAGVALENIVADFRQIDADWRLLSHRLAQSAGLSSTTLQSIDRIDRLDQQVGKLFQVEPSLDRRALQQQLGILDSSLYNISDALRRDLNASTKVSMMVSDTRKLQQQVARIDELVIDNYPYERIVSEYNRFERAWAVMLDQVTAISNPYIERSVRRIIDADNLIHELLWIENTTSRAQLKQTADALIRDVDEFYNRTPLKLLLTFKNATGTLQIADNFYGTVQNFKDNLDRNESDQELIESYRYVEEYGTIFVRTFSALKSQAAIVVLREIEDGMAALRAELNLGGTVSQVDTRELIPIAASLDNLAYQMEFDIRAWMNKARPTYRAEVTAASAAFMKRTQKLHNMLDSEPTLQELQRETDSLYQEWKTVYGFLSKCTTEERLNLSQIASEIRRDLTDLNSSLRL